MEYTASALVDQAFHSQSSEGGQLDVAAFESQQLQRLGMPEGIVMRHRPAHFQRKLQIKTLNLMRLRH